MRRASSLMAEASARMLGRERAALLAKAAAMPKPPKGQAYRLIRMGEGEGHDLIDAAAQCGSTFVYKSGKRYIVCDACGLEMTNLGKLRNARALAKAIGPKADAYFARAANGDRYAASAVARLCLMYRRKDDRE